MNSFSYEISSSTIMIKNIAGDKTEIMNVDGKIEVPISNKKLLDTNCKLFGSSLTGRLESSKEWLGCDYKLPILIDEFRNLVFFPLRSLDTPDNIWLSYNMIDDYRQTENGVEITLINGNNLIINESFGVFENQYIRAYKLHKRIERIKSTII